MKMLIVIVCAVGLLITVGCTDPQGTNWGTLNPVGVGIDVSRGDNSPGDTTINLDLDSGTSCGECLDDGLFPLPDLCSPTSCTLQPSPDSCIQRGGTVNCVPCDTCEPS